MERSIFLKHKGKHVVITLKPKGFVLSGKIIDVFEDCFEFKTDKKTSYIDFEKIDSLVVA
jgi:hypothetical protein